MRSKIKKKGYLSIIFSLVICLFFMSTQPLLASGNGKLYKIYYKKNYKITVIAPHKGWAGPWPETQNIKHVNIHIYKKYSQGKYKERANYHISSKTKGSKVCYYLYEKKRNKKWTNCKSNLNKGAAQKELQSKLKSDMNAVTGYEIGTTIAIVAGIVIIVWALWPASVIALAGL